MLVNANKPERWKSDIQKSVDFYNQWFLEFAPRTYRNTRVETTKQVIAALEWTKNLTDISSDILRKYPSVLPMMRMATAPPIARDRLIGLAGVSANLVRNMELQNRIPPRMDEYQLNMELDKIGNVIAQLIDKDIFTWLDKQIEPDEQERYRGATIVADRLTGAVADPIIRNAQEKRQLETIEKWLDNKGYHLITNTQGLNFREMESGTFAFRLNVPIIQLARSGESREVNIPIDVVIMPKVATRSSFPLLIEAKSAGDFTNTNKRRKEEATKIQQLKNTYGDDIEFVLFLCGYFDSGYLGYEAAEGIDWVWEHRVDDLVELGL